MTQSSKNSLARTRSLCIDLFISVVLIISAMIGVTALISGTFSHQNSQDLPRTHQRAGFGISTSADPQFWAGELGAGWYLDWNAVRPGQKQGPERWQMVRLKGNKISPEPGIIYSLAVKYPGLVWVIGNEPDNLYQDSITPQEFARLYGEAFHVIKRADPNAKIAVGGVTLSSPLRFEYLDRFLEEYQELYGEPLPVEWWTIHGYVLNEEQGGWGAEIPVGLECRSGWSLAPEDHGDTHLFEQRLVAFRIWMKEHGYQSIPLAVTEFGILLPETFGYTPDRIADYLLHTCSWMETTTNSQYGFPGDDGRLVQKWNWFSLSDPQFTGSNLANLETKSLTPVGSAFRQCVKRFSMD